MDIIINHDAQAVHAVQQRQQHPVVEPPQGIIVAQRDKLVRGAGHASCHMHDNQMNNNHEDQRHAGDAEKVPGKGLKAANRRSFPIYIRSSIPTAGAGDVRPCYGITRPFALAYAGPHRATHDKKPTGENACLTPSQGVPFLLSRRNPRDEVYKPATPVPSPHSGRLFRRTVTALITAPRQQRWIPWQLAA